MTGSRPRPGAVVYVKALAAGSEFYQRVAGLSVEDADEDFVMLGAPDLQVALVRIPDAIAETIEIAVPAERREDTAIKLLLPVASIAEAREPRPGPAASSTRRNANGRSPEASAATVTIPRATWCSSFRRTDHSG